MSQSKSFWEHPVEVLEEALSIKKQIAALKIETELLGTGLEGVQNIALAVKLSALLTPRSAISLIASFFRP